MEAGTIKSIERIALEMASSLQLPHVLSTITQGLVDDLDAAFARIWLIGPGDLCNDCHKADVCNARERCLHLEASAGLYTNLDGEYRRVPLPGYAFQHGSYWIEPGTGAHERVRDDEPERLAELDEWFFEPAWKEAPPERPRPSEGSSWLVFLDGAGAGARLCDRLRERGDDVVVVHEGDAFYQLSEGEYVLSPEHGRDGCGEAPDADALGRIY